MSVGSAHRAGGVGTMRSSIKVRGHVPLWFSLSYLMCLYSFFLLCFVWFNLLKVSFIA